MQTMLDTILNVFSYTNFEGSVCAWYLEHSSETYDPIFTIEFRSEGRLHLIQGVVPTDVALSTVSMMEEIGYDMVEIDGSTVQ